MRKVVGALAVIAFALPTATGAAGGDRTVRRVHVPAHLSVRVPAGWHVRHGWLSDVIDPAPRLAMASFPAKLSRHTCACGFPHVVHFPRDGAFVFVWEYLRARRRGLAGVPRRPVHFHLTGHRRVRQTCTGPTDIFAFKDAGRVFDVNVYLGPGVRQALRQRVASMLDSLRAAALT